ncbi:MAG TPA: hypothetical protein VN680_07540 [Burkholderiaceae bacterium]|jgi:hypothetical protein|nr:hypothetical protein [Burkholderiaceae bacterium]
MKSLNCSKQAQLQLQPACARHAALAALAVAAALACNLARAQSEPSQWKYEVTPYLWGVNLDGDTRAGYTPDTHVEHNAMDIASSLSFGAMGAFEARKDRYGVLADAFYVRLTEDSFKVIDQMYSMGGAYRLNDLPLPVDALAYVRYTHLTVRNDWTGLEDAKGWADLLVGARMYAPLAEGWTAVGEADLGGGGSKLTWQMLAGANWAMNPTTNIKMGYRYLKVDYERDLFKYDMAMKGLYAGVGFSF